MIISINLSQKLYVSQIKYTDLIHSIMYWFMLYESE